MRVLEAGQRHKTGAEQLGGAEVGLPGRPPVQRIAQPIRPADQPLALHHE